MGCAAVGVGSNLGEAEASVRAAIEALSAVGRIVRVSRLYKTRAWGFTRQPDFINAVVLLETDLAPRALMTALQHLERRLGRRPNFRWGPRTIDLDILTYDDARVDERDLQIPHPQLYERAFALVPLAEVDPRFAAARDALPERELYGVSPL